MKHQTVMHNKTTEIVKFHRPKVSLIIACYNHAVYLEKVFYSLLNQKFSDFEVVIADDGSGPEIGKLVEDFSGRFNFPIQHIWHEDHGFRKTIIVNSAVRQSKSDYLIFIDGDCILHHKFILRHYLRRSPGIVLSGRRIMLNEERCKSITIEMVKNRAIENLSFWSKNCSLKELKRGLYLPFIFHFINFIGKDYWAFGSNFSIHKSDFTSVNGYDESIIGRGLEDINLSQRFKLKGYKTWRLTNEAIQYHLFHNSDPIPHSGEEERSIIYPQSFYAQKGIS
jgi:glycosyltransferase involved in cell wall biosynthesis